MQVDQNFESILSKSQKRNGKRWKRRGGERRIGEGEKGICLSPGDGTREVWP